MPCFIPDAIWSAVFRELNTSRPCLSGQVSPVPSVWIPVPSAGTTPHY